MISRREFTAAALGAAPALAAGRRQPNIVFVCADQHSGLMLGSMGHRIVKTPNLDRLASLGVQFRNAYCGSPVCVPSRAGMMTGMYPSDVNSYCNSTPFVNAAPTWGQRLKDSGYRCWATGKLDLTKGMDYGFEEVKTGHGHSTNPDITSLFRAPLCMRREERALINGAWKNRTHEDEAVTGRALDFLRKQDGASGKPWAMYVGLHLPHPKWVAQERYRAMYPPESMPLPDATLESLEKRHPVYQALANSKNFTLPIPETRVRRARSAYFGMVTELDALVGRILSEVENARQLDNTLFIYTSDHGEMFGEHGLWLKDVLLENAARVPMIMAGAGLPRGKRVDAPVTHSDLVATMLECGGAAHDPKLRGRSLLNSTPAFAYSESHSEGNYTGSFMIRRGDWKYIYFSGDEPLLFDLKNDPGEKTNLAREREDVRKELHGLLTSVVNPDAVTRRAFAEQQRRLQTMVKEKTAQEFYEELEGRLGSGQAWAIMQKYYGRA